MVRGAAGPSAISRVLASPRSGGKLDEQFVGGARAGGRRREGDEASGRIASVAVA